MIIEGVITLFIFLFLKHFCPASPGQGITGY
jgi:hypothetical protein